MITKERDDEKFINCLSGSSPGRLKTGTVLNPHERSVEFFIQKDGRRGARSIATLSVCHRSIPAAEYSMGQSYCLLSKPKLRTAMATLE